MRGAFALALALVVAGCGGPEPDTIGWRDVTDGIARVDARPHGRIDVDVTLPAGPQPAAIAFSWLAPLDGAKVSVAARTPYGEVPLVSGRRIGGTSLVVPLTAPHTSAVRVSVHHHVRAVPVLRSVKLAPNDPSAPSR